MADSKQVESSTEWMQLIHSESELLQKANEEIQVKLMNDEPMKKCS